MTARRTERMMAGTWRRLAGRLGRGGMCVLTLALAAAACGQTGPLLSPPQRPGAGPGGAASAPATAPAAAAPMKKPRRDAVVSVLGVSFFIWCSS